LNISAFSSSSWSFLKPELHKSYFTELKQFVESEYSDKSMTVFPNKGEIFRAFDSCKFEDVKVVILGQDPYPTIGHANGLCFSVQPDLKKLPKSLVNIFKEIDSDLNHEKNITENRNGDLTRWAKQGVFLLNTILTVRKGESMSHANQGWETFTDEVLESISEKGTGIVFMLWGNKAQEKLEHLDLSKHLVLNSVHPSPLSAYRGFFGCKHFSKANEYLKKIGKTPIDWR